MGTSMVEYRELLDITKPEEAKRNLVATMLGYAALWTAPVVGFLVLVVFTYR